MTAAQRKLGYIMVWATDEGYFGFLSSCSRTSNGYWKVTVDGETAIYTLTQLVDEYNALDKSLQRQIVNDYYNR